MAASRAHELAGLVTPGKAVKDICRFRAPVICRVPLKLISPGIDLPLAASLALACAEALAAGADEEPLALAWPDPPADEATGELQAARPAVSSRQAAVPKPRTRSGRLVRTRFGRERGDGMKGSIGPARGACPVVRG